MSVTDLDSLAATRREPGRAIYTRVAIVAAAVVLAGFARSYYAKTYFGTPELDGLRHLHGVVMTSWFAIFAVQVRLVANRRTDLHRKVGVAGALVALMVVIVGTAMAISLAAAGKSPVGAPPPLVFLAIPLGDMVLFAGLVGAALWLRRKPEYHKRLMVCATLSMLTAAIARIPLDFLIEAGLPAFFATTDLILLSFIVADTMRHRRLHAAYAWGFGIVIASQAARFLGAGTPQWLAFAKWLTT